MWIVSRSRKPKKAQTADPEAKPEQPRRRRIWLRTVILVLIVGVVMGAVLGGKNLPRMWTMSELNSHIDELLAEPKQPKPPIPAHPYLREKLIVVDREARRISDLYYELPDAVRADSLDEAGTIAWLDFQTRTEGKEGAQYTSRSCQVTLIDRNGSKVLDQPIFKVLGAPDDKPLREQILNYLTHLPPMGRHRGGS
jgi:hypothetical protein